MRTSEIITFCYLRSQGVALPRRRLWQGPCGREVPLAKGVHDLFMPAVVQRAAQKGLNPSIRGNASYANKTLVK